MKKLKKVVKYIKKNGFKLFVLKLCHRKRENKDNYSEWKKNHLLISEIEKIRDYNTKISILVPVYCTPERFLREMIDSVIEQSYPNWELCIADASPDERTYKTIEKYLQDSRIVYKKLQINGGISENTNAALEMATGDYIGLLDHDDLLEPTALEECIKVIQDDSKVEIIYSDEDKVDTDTETYFDPHFKKDFNLELLRENNYICHFLLVKTAIVKKAGGFNKEYDGAQDHDFIFRCVEHAEHIRHISKVLYHWRVHKLSTAENPESKLYAYEAGKRAVTAHLQRMNELADVKMTDYPGFYEVEYQLKEKPPVLIVIIGKIKKNSLNKMIKNCGYPNYRVQQVTSENEIAQYISKKDKYLVVIKADVRIVSAEWLRKVLACVQRNGIGLVGGKIYKRDERIYHAGIHDNTGEYCFRGMSRVECGYFHHEILQQEIYGVTTTMVIMPVKLYLQSLEAGKSLENEVEFCDFVKSMNNKIIYYPRWEGVIVK